MDTIGYLKICDAIDSLIILVDGVHDQRKKDATAQENIILFVDQNSAPVDIAIKFIWDVVHQEHD